MYTLSELVDRVERLSAKTQYALYEYLSHRYVPRQIPDGLSDEYVALYTADLIDINKNTVSVSQNAYTNRRKLYDYLSRKFRTIDELYETVLPLDAPEGSIICNDKLEFPDDEITDLLNKYNVNPLNPPIPIVMGSDGRYRFDE